MLQGADPLDAAIAGVNINEDDPKDDSVGLGGLPNEDGVVELDSAVMHGPTARAGAVAALQSIRNPSLVAKQVMERSDHVLLVGEGALRFARAHGFQEENLLTEASRKKWLQWKESLSNDDDWLAPPPPADDQARAERRPTGTIHLSALDAHANLGCVTTTSGLAYKIPGRVGDSPIIGAGLYLDNEIGSAGSTGRGEANLLNCSSFLIVEEMRRGASPTDACLAACKRISAMTKEKRLLDAQGRPAFDVKFHALDKQGRHGSAALWSGAKYAIADSNDASIRDSAYVFERGKS
jgi:N4-(beta-N-acetylglucosaminyl)-L-asparaginase